ncbi:MAG TPA: NAD(P)-binding protein [Acetivibrio sp.]|uniref:NAD(P)/FAD-dependent oxidoreductase n=1 Tax=Acetivibrio sp. TaxID=1872092 RepID=UPI002C0EF5A5|nr:FAD-dependent oxidoreductase [Acetivibrio sp.]HOM03288.1 NAD(P)-binding protein [Acetivibrio sp.]
MKVAIIGAGLAGLACAFELERNEISPVIFEKKSYIGENYMYSSTTLRLFDRSYTNPVKYFNKKYNLNLVPFCPLKEIVMKGPSKQGAVSGRLGYVFMRGDEKNSLENQIARHVNAPIHFDTYINVDDIKKDFDHVIVATGDETVANHLGVWHTTTTVHTRVALVLGDFKVGSAKMWVNREYSKACYGFLSPHSKRDGRLLLSVNDISTHEFDHYWNNFARLEEVKYKITETRDIVTRLGYVSSVKVENIYLTGSAAGLIDDFLGFGAINAIESGILAAQAIIKDKDYSELIRPIKEHTAKIHEFRKMVNEFSNEDYDRLIKILTMPLVKRIIYNNPAAKAQNISSVARRCNNLKHKRQRRLFRS